MCRLIKSNDLSGCNISSYLRSALWHRPSLGLLWGVPDNDRTPCFLHWFLIQAISNCNRCNNEADGLLFINCKIVKPFNLVWFMNSPAALKSICRFFAFAFCSNLEIWMKYLCLNKWIIEVQILSVCIWIWEALELLADSILHSVGNICFHGSWERRKYYNKCEYIRLQIGQTLIWKLETREIYFNFGAK